MVITSLIATEASMTLVGEAEDGVEAVLKARALRPDVILMDLNMPYLSGLAAIERITPLDLRNKALAEDLRRLCRVSVIENCAAVTLVGRRIRTILHELSPALEVFQEQKVHLVTQAANDLNLTFVVDAEHALRLVQHLHGLLVSKLEGGGVFGPTWEQIVTPRAVRAGLPEPWWMAKRERLPGVGATLGSS